MYQCCMSTSAPCTYFCNKDVLKTNVKKQKKHQKTVVLEKNSATAHAAGGGCLQELPKTLHSFKPRGLLCSCGFGTSRCTIPASVATNISTWSQQQHLFTHFMVPGYSGSCWVHLQCLLMIIAAVPSVTKSGYSSSISYTHCYKIWLQQQYQLHSVLQNLVTAAVSVTLLRWHHLVILN